MQGRYNEGLGGGKWLYICICWLGCALAGLLYFFATGLVFLLSPPFPPTPPQLQTKNTGPPPAQGILYQSWAGLCPANEVLLPKWNSQLAGFLNSPCTHPPISQVFFVFLLLTVLCKDGVFAIKAFCCGVSCQQESCN